MIYWPKNPLRLGESVDVTEFNRSCREVIAEVQGLLGEHNFTNEFVVGSRRTRMASDVAQELWVQNNPSNPEDPSVTHLKISRSQRWTVLASGRFTPKTSGKALLGASFHAKTTEIGGVEFCLRFNGTRLADSIFGSGDSSNDLTHQVVFGAGSVELSREAPGMSGSVPIVVTSVARHTKEEQFIELLGRVVEKGASTPISYIANCQLFALSGYC